MPLHKALAVPGEPLAEAARRSKLIDPRSLFVPLLTDDNATLWERQKEVITQLPKLWAKQRPQVNPCVLESTPVAARCIQRWMEGSGRAVRIDAAEWKLWVQRYPTLREKIGSLQAQLRGLSRLPNPALIQRWQQPESKELRQGHERLLTFMRTQVAASNFDPASWTQEDEPKVNLPFYVGLETHGTREFLEAGHFSVAGALSVGRCAFEVNDLVLTVGRFGLRLYVNGKFEQSKDKESPLKGYLKIQAAGYRLNDRFGFDDDQTLGFWDGSGFRSDVGGIPLNNAAMRKFHLETGKGADFDVFTDVVAFDLKALGLTDRAPIPIYETMPTA